MPNSTSITAASGLVPGRGGGIPPPPAARADPPEAAGPDAAQLAAAAATAATAATVQVLYEAHASTMVRLANLLVRDPALAEDIVQDAFLHLYRAGPRLRDRDDLRPYLRTAVVNGCRSALRGRRRAAARVPRPDPPVASAESATLLSEERREVFAALAGLPRRAREVLALRYYLDLTDLEIAATLGISRGTVSSTASRALTALARELKEDL